MKIGIKKMKIGIAIYNICGIVIMKSGLINKPKNKKSIPNKKEYKKDIEYYVQSSVNVIGHNIEREDKQ